MKKEQTFLIFILLLTSLSVYLLYEILSPFLTSIVWAIILALVFFPLSQKLERMLKKKKVLSAMIMTLFVFSVIVLPFSFLMASLAVEMVEVYHRIQKIIETGQLQLSFQKLREIPMLQWILARLDQYLDFSQADPQSLLLKNVQYITTFLFNHTSKMLKGLSTFMAAFFFTLLSLYYLFKDGAHLLEKFKEIIPLPPKETNLLLQRSKEMISATIYGGILIAIIQGMLGGLAFWALGIPSPILWGTAMGLFSFIPIGGTAFIWLPASLYLFLKGALLKGLLLIALGVFVISMADNLVRPSFISSKTNIHPLLLFFAVLGGIHAFGLIGIVSGPLIVTLFLTLVEIYIQEIKPHTSNRGE